MKSNEDFFDKAKVIKAGISKDPIIWGVENFTLFTPAEAAWIELKRQIHKLAYPEKN